MFIRIIAVCFFFGFLLNGGLVSQDNWNQTTAVADYKTTLKQYLKNIESKSRDQDLMANIGEAYYFLNQMSEAKQWFAKSVEIAPLSQKHQLQYGKSLMALKDYSAAKNWFLLYAETNPEVGTHYAKSVDLAVEMDKIAAIYSAKQIPFNTAGAELSASIVGNRLYYLIKTNFGMKLVYAEGINDSSPLRYMGEINTGIKLEEVSWFSFSSNRQKVAYVKQKSFAEQRQIPETGFKASLYIAEVRADGTWINSKAFPHNDQNNILYPSFSQDGSTLYFASDRLDGFGGLDIYSSTLSAGNWSFPLNAGPDINTPGHEISPFYSNGSLYFSSNWHEGFGGYDIFRADLSNTNRIRIYHQGKEVNSSRDDLGMQLAAGTEKGFIVSNRVGTAGGEDLYSIQKGGMNSELIVFDANSKTVIPNATIDMTACGGTVTTTDFEGKFIFQQTDANNCILSISKEGYQASQLTLGTSKRSNYTVSLSKAAQAFEGIIVDETSGYILDNVNVLARDISTGSTMSAISNEKGQYSLALNAGKSYSLTFKKTGYNTTAKDIQAQTTSNLGIVSLMKSKTAPIVSQPSTSPIISTPSTSTASSQPAFAVQIAAIKPGKQIDLNSYAALNSIGNVFVENGYDYNRVRVGRFMTKAEAESAKAKIKSKGYKSAYVVEQQTVTSTTSVISASPSVDTTDKSPVYRPSANQEFRIRLTALRNADNFNYTTAQQYGKVETTRSNGFTVFYIVGIKDIENGRIYLQQLKNNGFSDAYLVQNKNGILSKVN